MTVFSKNRQLHYSTVRVISLMQEAAKKQPSCFWLGHLLFLQQQWQQMACESKYKFSFVLSLLKR